MKRGRYQYRTSALCAFLVSIAVLPGAARPIVGLTSQGQLVHFDSATPATITSSVTITGLVSGDSIHAIDFRPANGRLYGLGLKNTAGQDEGRLYAIDPSTGVATAVGAQPFTTTLTDASSYGFEFNPVSDRIRVVNSADQNLRVNPDTGALSGTDTPLDNASESEGVTGLAHDRNDRNPGTATTLFGMDFITGKLVRIGSINGLPSSPNGGGVTSIGSLGLITGNTNFGFDIDDNGIAYASIGTGNGPTTYGLYTINLTTGAANSVAPIGSGLTNILSVAVTPKPVTNANTFEIFDTIQGAIDDANTLGGHAIDVNPGTYPESVTVNKAVVLRGAKFGLDARGPRGSGESIVRGELAGSSRRTPFNITTSGVTLDGFVVQDNTNAVQFATGIRLAGGTAGSIIRNNIVNNNITGLLLANNSATAQTVIEHNFFQANNQPLSFTSGTGIYTDETFAGGPLLNVLINENLFMSHSKAAVFLGSFAAGSQSRIIISSNVMVANDHGVALYNTIDSTVARNQMSGSVDPTPSVLIGGGVNGLELTENFIESGNGSGISIGDFGGGAANTNIFATCNSIQGNAGAGLQIENGGYTGSLDVTRNWWGSATGPTITSNPGGTGQQIIDPGGQANFSDFLPARDDRQLMAPGFQCDPSTIFCGVTSSNTLVRFSSAAPETILSSSAITGMQPGDAILGIDFRPTTGELFALGNNRLYVINPSTGAATLRATLSAAAGDPFFGLSGTAFGVDFDPFQDLAGGSSLRVVSNADQNVRINANNGLVTTSANITNSLIEIDALAFTNTDLDPATGTELRGYDTFSNELLQIFPAGSYNFRGASGIVASPGVHFDIQTVGGFRNILFASLQTSSSPTKLYIVNINNGLMMPIGEVGTGVPLARGLAIVPVGAFQFSAPSYSVSETGPTATITVNRVGGSEGAVSVRFKTQDGTATASQDYTGVDQVLSFSSGVTSQTVNIVMADDSLDEPDETIGLSLSTPTDGATLGSPVSVLLTLIDNDAAPTPTPAAGLVANVSTRLSVGADDNALIEGFIVQGPSGSSKKILVRALGPFLTQFGITDALANPTLEIHDSSNATVATNNNWKTTEVGGLITGDQFPEISASGLAPSDDVESAIVANLAPGSYTAVVRGLGNTTGTGIVDAFDLSAASTAKVVNFATRGLIQPGDKLLTAGFIIQNGAVRAVIRAIGPSLTGPPFNITNALPDTILQLRDQNGMLVQENDDWETDQKPELEMTGLQPSNSKEAALVRTIPPGQYTAQVRGKPEATGTGVVEVYFID